MKEVGKEQGKEKEVKHDNGKARRMARSKVKDIKRKLREKEATEKY